MDALVLSGGNLKGSWQAGVIAEVLAAGYQPEIVTGISVGALNAAYLAAYQPGDDAPPDEWGLVGADLADFWCDRITGPASIIQKRGILDLALRYFRKDWGGLVSTEPLARLVRRTFDGVFPFLGSLRCRVGAVNLRTGDLEYHAPDSPRFLDAVLASTAEPIGMPARRIGRDWYVDGGVREITPLAEAIRLGADRIICAVCQPAWGGEWAGNKGDLLPLIGRELGIVSDEITVGDLRRCAKWNRLLLELPPEALAHPIFAAMRPIEVIVVRPLVGVNLNLESFTAKDIERAVAQGRADAIRVLGDHGLARAA